MRSAIVIVAVLFCACRSARPDRAIVESPGRDLREARVAAEKMPAVDSVGGIAEGTRWESHGPQNISGVTYALLFDPANPNLYFAGSSEALWRSDDAGANWTAVPDLDGMQVMSLLRDPRDGNIIYAATGFEGAGADGIYKSTDRGATWHKLAGSPVSPTIRSLAISPDDSKILLAGTSSGIFRTADAGEHWTQVVGAGVNATVAFAPGDGAHAVAGLRDEGTFGGRAHLMFSTDGGATWQNAAGINVAMSYSVFVTYAPSISGRVYASTTGAASPVWRSDDGGRTFAVIPSTLSGYHIRNVLLATPHDDTIIYGGIAVAYSSGGAPFQPVPTTQAAGGFTWPHADVLGLFADPHFDGSSNKRVFACTDGGIFVTDDFTAGNWTLLGHGATSTQFYAVDVGAQGTIAGGMQDNGISYLPSGSSDVAHTRDGDTSNLLLDPIDERRCYAGTYPGKVTICTSTTLIADVAAGPRFGIPMAIAPSDPSRMFVASMHVFRVDNLQTTAKLTLLRLSDGTTHYNAIAVHPGSADVVLLAADDGTIYRITNATSSTPQWSTFFTSTPDLSAALPSTILFDRHDPRTIYVGADAGILQTTDDGATWHSGNGASAGAMLPPVPVRKIVEHPGKHGWLYAATPIGLFVSADGGARWSRAPGPAAPVKLDIRDLVFRPKTTTLYLATFGRGVWSADVPGEILPRRRALR